MKIKASDINPKESNAENARRLGVDPSAVTRARKRLCIQLSPKTKGKLSPEVKERRAKRKLERSYAFRREQHGALDWRMSDLELSMRTGSSVAQVSRWRKEAKAPNRKGRAYDVERLISADAKLSERKTVHEWLNDKGVPREASGKPLCLLRRLSIALGISEHESNGVSVPAGTEPKPLPAL